MTIQNDRKHLINDINQSLTKVNNHAIRYRKTHTLLAVCTIVLGLFATLLAGDSARSGDILAGNTAKIATGNTPTELPRGWRIVCGVIAVCTFLSTAAAGIDRVLRITDHRANAMACAGQMDGLRTELETNSKPTGEQIANARDTYINLRRQYAEYFR